MECQACNGGTTVANLIAGKTRFLNEVAPGQYYVHSQVSPGFNWFFNELTAGQDIEVLVGFYNGNTRLGGHYITLNGISGDDTDDSGFLDSTEANIDFIDPSGGADRNRGLFEFNDHSLGTSFGVGGTINGTAITTTVIEWGIAESPVPEPGTVLLILACAPLLLWARRRKSA